MTSRAREFDPDRVLCYAPGHRVPSRIGAVEWARDAVTTGTTPVVALAMAIALRIDDTLVCWPKQDRLAADIRGAIRTVGKSLVILTSQRIVVPLYLYRGRECTGAIYAMNLDGWLDDVWSDREGILARIHHVRSEAVRLERSAYPLPKGTHLQTNAPAKPGKKRG